MDMADIDRTSENNSNPPDIPDDYAGSSVSSRLQDEYEELLKYAVVIPKFDVNDLPRTLADNKQTFARPRNTTPSEIEHTSDSEDDDRLNRNDNAAARRPNHQERIVTPGYRLPNTENDIQTLTPRTRLSPPGKIYTPSAAAASLHHRIEPAANLSESEESETTELVYERTDQSERAPSETELHEIEKKLDIWTRQLNSNIMDEISRLRLKMIESSRHELQTAKSRHAGEMNSLQSDLESMKELLHTYEVSIERKDGVIANLTRSLQNQKEKFDTLRSFTDWKMQFAASRQEGYGMRLAARHHELVMKRKCWKMWHQIIVDKWRRRVEKACQAKSQEVCIALTNDYEAKLKSLDEKYAASRSEVLVLHRERESYEESMKKAFMRGVCALNMEAMNMFHEPDEQENRVTDNPVVGPGLDSGSSLPTQSHKVPSSYQPSHPYTVSHGPAYTSSSNQSGLRGKRLNATVSASRTASGSKVSSQRLTDGNSVLVERHDNSQVASDQSSEVSSVRPPSRLAAASGSASKRPVGHSLSSRVVRIVK